MNQTPYHLMRNRYRTAGNFSGRNNCLTKDYVLAHCHKMITLPYLSTRRFCTISALHMLPITSLLGLLSPSHYLQQINACCNSQKRPSLARCRWQGCCRLSVPELTDSLQQPCQQHLASDGRILLVWQPRPFALL